MQPTRDYAIAQAKKLKKSLVNKGFSIESVGLFGSAAKDEMHEWSDIDIAIVSRGFKNSKMEELHEFSRIAHDIDVKIELVCLRPADFSHKYFTLAKEVEKYGLTI